MNRQAMSWVFFLLAGMVAGAALFYWFGPDTRPRPETDPAVFMAPAPRDPAAPADTPRYEFQEAVNSGLIDYVMTGTGSSSGESVMLYVRRLSDSPIDVYVVPGTVFASNNPDAQRMVAWGVVGAVGVDDNSFVQVTSMYLPTPDLRSFVVEAYCLDFELANPEIADHFAPAAEPAAARSAQIIYEGKRSELSIGAIQSAIWIDQDDVSKQKIQEHFDASDEEIDQAFELLKRTPPPKS